MSIWSTVSGMFTKATTTPPFNPTSAPTSTEAKTPELQEVTPTHAATRAHLFPHLEEQRDASIEPELEEVEVNYGGHSLIAPTLTKASLDAEKQGSSFSFNPAALAGLPGPAGGGGAAPYRGAGVGDMGILKYYDRMAPFQQAIAQQSLLAPGLAQLTGRRM